MFMNEKFEAVISFLSDADWDACFTVTFEDICHKFQVPPDQVDNFLYETFGMSGEEIMEICRNGRSDASV